MKNVAVNAIILSEDQQQVLLILRRDIPVWVLPGGGVDSGESPEAAVVREAKEETGYDVAIVRKSAVYMPINRLAHPTHLFVCRIISGAASTGAETRAVAFYPLSALPRNFFYIHSDFIHDALSHPDSILEKPLSQVTYLALLKYFFSHPLLWVRAVLSRIGLPFNSR